MNHPLTIDDKPVTIVRIERAHGCYARLFVKPQGAEGGPQAQHDVPFVQGIFRTNGHTYKFSAPYIVMNERGFFE